MELEKGNNKIDERNRPVSLLECSTEPLRNEGRAIHSKYSSARNHRVIGLKDEDLPGSARLMFAKHMKCVCWNELIDIATTIFFHLLSTPRNSPCSALHTVTCTSILMLPSSSRQFTPSNCRRPSSNAVEHILNSFCGTFCSKESYTYVWSSPAH